MTENKENEEAHQRRKKYRNEDYNDESDMGEESTMMNKMEDSQKEINMIEFARRTEKPQRGGETKEVSRGERGIVERLRKETKLQKDFKKEATLILEVSELDNIMALEVIKAVDNKVVQGKLIRVRQRQNGEYEIMLENEEVSEELLNGLKIGGNICEIRKICATEVVVSFLNLPTHITDAIILD